MDQTTFQNVFPFLLIGWSAGLFSSVVFHVVFFALNPRHVETYMPDR